MIPVAWCVASCAASLGPGYAIDKQEIHVEFTPDAQPVIRIAAEYRLRNNGNQPLTTLELRLPGRRRFHIAAPKAEWDVQEVVLTTSHVYARNVVFLLS